MQTKRLKLSESLQLFENEDLETGIAYYVKRFNGVNDEKVRFSIAIVDSFLFSKNIFSQLLNTTTLKIKVKRIK